MYEVVYVERIVLFSEYQAQDRTDIWVNSAPRVFQLSDIDYLRGVCVFWPLLMGQLRGLPVSLSLS